MHIKHTIQTPEFEASFMQYRYTPKQVEEISLIRPDELRSWRNQGVGALTAGGASAAHHFRFGSRLDSLRWSYCVADLVGLATLRMFLKDGMALHEASDYAADCTIALTKRMAGIAPEEETRILVLYKGPELDDDLDAGRRYVGVMPAENFADAERVISERNYDPIVRLVFTEHLISELPARLKFEVRHVYEEYLATKARKNA